jgi:hypothetical protein
MVRQEALGSVGTGAKSAAFLWKRSSAMRRTFWLLATAVVAVFLLGTSTAEAGKSITSPDMGADVGQHTSLALDSNGYPVISYYDVTNGDLKVIHCGNADCTAGYTMASPDTAGDVGQYNSLALDGSGNPVVSYYDATNGALKLLHCNDANCAGGDESIASLDWGADIGRYSSLALTPYYGAPVISYYNANITGLQVLFCSDANCTGSYVANSPDYADDVGQYTSLVLDGNIPVISYYDATNGNLKVVHCTDAECDTGNVTSPDTTNNVGAHTSLVLDSSPSHKPVVSYYDVTNGNLKVLHCGNANCTSGNAITSPDTAGAVGAYTSLALDGDDNPAVSYYDVTNGDLKVLDCGNHDCSSGNAITSPDTTGAVGAYTSLALDANKPVVSYYDAANGNLKVLRCGDANCSAGNTLASPDTGPAVGGHTWLALDVFGKPVVSYHDVTNRDLKVLHCGNANCTSGNSITAPDTTGDVGADTSLALDASGRPVVSYSDFGSGDLKVLHCGNVDCTAGNSITVPDTISEGVWYTSLALDASGNPVVSYGDIGNGDLKVMHCNDPNCDPTVSGAESVTSPDTEGDVGRHVSLALDGIGHPVVSYYDGTNGDLKVLHCSDANCTETGEYTSPDTGGDVGTFTYLVLDGNGNPVVSYYDQTNFDLKVMHCNDPNCAGGGESITAPDTTVGGAYLLTSLKLDTAGNPVVSYVDSYNLDLKVLHCNDPNCAPGGDSITSPDTVGSVGLDSSLVLDGRGSPVVSYYDWTNGDLKVLHCDTPSCGTPAYPPAGTDEMPVSLHFAHVYLDEDDNGVPETDAGAATFTGTGKFSRGIPYLEGVYNTIDTAILSMVLTGTVAGYQVTIKAGTEQSLSASTGKIREQTPGTLFPADTWFDVFFKIVSTDPDYGVMQNCNFGAGAQSVRLNGVTTAIPDTYVEYLVPSCPLAPPPASCATACQGGGLLGVGEVIPQSPMRMCTGTDPSGNPVLVYVGGIAEWPGTAAGPDSLADSSAGSGFNYTALGAALGAAAVALAAGAWFARRRWAR